MATVLVSGVVDEVVRDKAEAVAKEAGTTLESLITEFVIEIARTSRIPEVFLSSQTD